MVTEMGHIAYQSIRLAEKKRTDTNTTSLTLLDQKLLANDGW